jgi:hypothetical protein
MVWQFTGNNFLSAINGVNNSKGTFTYTATIITLTFTHEWNGSSWKSWSNEVSANYSISGNNLKIVGDGIDQSYVKINH